MHNNMELSNNSVVLREEIGEGEKALICQTLSDAQCGGSESLAMFFPNSTEVLPAGNGRTVYSTTGDGQVRLNRKLEDDSPLGSYYCQIPDRVGNIQKMFIRIGMLLYISLELHGFTIILYFSNYSIWRSNNL
jgi:hypothetical protein